MLTFQAYFYANGDAYSMYSGDHNKTKAKKPAKPTDALTFKSARLFPNFKPKVVAEVDEVAELTEVSWTIPFDDIVEEKAYKHTVKFHVGTDASSGDVLNVVFGADAFGEIGTAQVLVK